MTPKQIKALRDKLDLNQVELGEMLGLSARTIMRWENGHKQPNTTQEMFLRYLVKNKK